MVKKNHFWCQIINFFERKKMRKRNRSAEIAEVEREASGSAAQLETREERVAKRTRRKNRGTVEQAVLDLELLSSSDDDFDVDMGDEAEDARAAQAAKFVQSFSCRPLLRTKSGAGQRQDDEDDVV
jgi:hypothetical protein